MYFLSSFRKRTEGNVEQEAVERHFDEMGTLQRSRHRQPLLQLIQDTGDPSLQINNHYLENSDVPTVLLSVKSEASQ